MLSKSKSKKLFEFGVELILLHFKKFKNDNSILFTTTDDFDVERKLDTSDSQRVIGCVYYIA